MIEVEIKLANADHKELKDKLSAEGFSFLAAEQETDTYFNSEFHEMKVHDQALRVRKSLNLLTGEESCTVNFKDKKYDKISMTRPEYETEVSDGSVMKTILSSIGFYPVPEVMKTRYSYKRENVTACLDEVKGLGCFLELESVIDEGGDRELVLSELFLLAERLGMKREQSVTKSYLSMLTEKLKDR